MQDKKFQTPFGANHVKYSATTVISAGLPRTVFRSALAES
eukprot:COSAG04_NODE_7188_length_1171_cov_2.381530_1_plen_39_part_10